MNILEKLVQLANTLDQKGLHKEASLLDEIIKEAAEPIYEAAPPGFRDVFYQAPLGYRETEQERSKRITDEGLARLKQMDEQGLAGGGAKRYPKGPKFLEFQKQYNQMWDQLKQMGLSALQGFGPRLREDGIRGPQTQRAETVFPYMQNILANEQRTAPKGFDFAKNPLTPAEESEMASAIGDVGPGTGVAGQGQKQ